MRIKESEIAKVKSDHIARLEVSLNDIDRYEQDLVASFDKYLDAILGDITKDILELVKNIPNISDDNSFRIRINDTEYRVPKNFLKTFHKSQINDSLLRTKYEEKLTKWFASKTEQIRNGITNKDSYEDIERMMPPAFALASLAITSFHNKSNIILNDVQKLTGISLSQGDVTELGNGEGKTLAAVLPTYLYALRGKGAHVISSNNYLARRDYEETLPIFKGLGLTSGYLPENIVEIGDVEGKDFNVVDSNQLLELNNKLRKIKQEAYNSDITYGSNNTYALDYLNDSVTTNKEDLVLRNIKPGFALVDDIDNNLVDNASVPYGVTSNIPIYHSNMTVRELCLEEGIEYEKVVSILPNIGITSEHLTYEEARFIANNYGGRELLPSQEAFLEFAKKFFDGEKVLKVEENKYGFKSGKELYEAILDETKYDSELLRKTYGIIYCDELKQYKIADKTFESFLKQVYFNLQISSQTLACQDKIKADSNYKENEDYTVVQNRIRLTLKGANKILNDSNYPEFLENYNKYLGDRNKYLSIASLYLKETVIANLLMEINKNYIVEDGKVTIIKNGKRENNSYYTNGLLQAIEVKENIPANLRTKIEIKDITVGEKDFLTRYDMYCGMTGSTSEIIFRDVYDKDTIKIPRNAFYKFYGKRKQANASEPAGVLKNNIKLTMTLDEKLNLIVNSIKSSLSIKQPVFVAVSNEKELASLSQALVRERINPTVILKQDSKELEAMKLARAGLPGNVTIALSIGGLGTNIKLGGDRDTIIDIETEQHIKSEENKSKEIVHFSISDREKTRDEVEKYLTDMGERICWPKETQEANKKALEANGLKVILSGFNDLSRTDKQLEDKADKSGISGTFEQYACSDDIKRLGLASFNSKDSIEETLSKYAKNEDGSLNLEEKDCQDIMNVIKAVQDYNENDNKARIIDAQRINSASSKLVDQYRNERRKIVCDEVNVETLITQMIERAADGIISSYIGNKNVTKDSLSLPISSNGLGVDVLGISLEAKKYLGVTFDHEQIIKSNMNLQDLKAAIIKTANDRFKTTSADPKQALIAEKDFLINNIPTLLEHSFTVRRLTTMEVGSNNQVSKDDQELIRIKKSLIIEACKEGAKTAIGIPLSKEEFKQLEMQKSKINEYVAYKPVENKADYSEPQHRSESLIDRFKRIKERLAANEQKHLERAENGELLPIRPLAR